MTVRARQAVWTWALVVASAMSLPTLIASGSWVGAMVFLLTLIVAAVLVAQTLCQRLGMLWQLIICGLVAEFVLTCFIVHRLAADLAPGGFFPRVRALKASDQLLANALASVSGATPPASDAALFAPLAMLIIGHLAVLIAVVAIVTPWPALVGVLAAAPWVCVCMLDLGAGWGWAVVTAACYLGLLAWGSSPPGVVRTGVQHVPEPTGWGHASGRPSVGPGLVALVVALVCGMVAAMAAPGLPVWNQGQSWVQAIRTGPGRAGVAGPGIGVGGVFNLNQQLGNADQTVVLRVKGDYTGALKLYSLYTFNGVTWSAPTPSGDAQLIGSGTVLWPPTDGTTGWDTGSQLTLDLSQWPYAYLPMALGPRTIDIPDSLGAFYQVSNDAAVLTRGARVPEMLTETAPTFNPAQIATAGVSDTSPAAQGVDRPVPEPHAAEVASLAHQIVQDAGATTPDAQLRALVAYLQGPHFQYTLTPRVDPSSSDPVWDFLQRGTGYCVHFASALVTMGRALGIPMRVGIGYSGGTMDADGWREFTAAQAHMWAEADLDGVGWVPYEATKSSPTLVQTAAPSSASSTATDTAEPTLSASNSAAPSSDAASSQSPTAVATPAGSSTGATIWVILTFLLAAIVVVIVVRIFPAEHKGAEAVWDEVVLRARSLGLVAGATTPRQIWTAVRPHLPEGPPREAWDGLADEVEAGRYRPPGQRLGVAAPEQLRAWRTELLRALAKAPRHAG